MAAWSTARAAAPSVSGGGSIAWPSAAWPTSGLGARMWAGLACPAWAPSWDSWGRAVLARPRGSWRSWCWWGEFKGILVSAGGGMAARCRLAACTAPRPLTVGAVLLLNRIAFVVQRRLDLRQRDLAGVELDPHL